MSLALPSCSAGKYSNLTLPLVCLVTSSMKNLAVIAAVGDPAGEWSATRRVICCPSAGALASVEATSAARTAFPSMLMKSILRIQGVPGILTNAPSRRVAFQAMNSPPLM